MRQKNTYDRINVARIMLFWRIVHSDYNPEKH